MYMIFFRSNFQRGTKHNTIKMKKKQKSRGLTVKERSKWVRDITLMMNIIMMTVRNGHTHLPLRAMTSPQTLMIARNGQLLFHVSTDSDDNILDSTLNLTLSSIMYVCGPPHTHHIFQTSIDKVFSKKKFLAIIHVSVLKTVRK